MTTTRYLALLLSVCFAHLPGSVRSEDASDVETAEEQAIKEVSALVSPSLVRIETVGGLDRVGELLTGTGPTTGVIVSADGYLVSSSFNFISRPASILVTLADGRRLTAEQVATDKLKMITLLKIAADNLAPAVAAPIDSFRVGQWSIALGRTLDETTPNVSIGIVSALRRIWGKALQTDAKISPVNYGGALADIQGRVLGVLVPLSPDGGGEVAGVEWYDGGIGFAIPLADIYSRLDLLKQGKDLHPGLLGVTLKSHDPNDDQPRIDRVRYGSPAQAAGFKEGDVITAAGGQDVARVAQIKQYLGTKYAGDSVKLTVKRGEERIERELTLIETLVPYESAYLGILPVREQGAAESAQANDTAPEKDKPVEPAAPPAALSGVVLRFVFPDSPAARAGLERGDVILTCDGKAVTTAEALRDLIGRHRPGEKAPLRLRRGGEERSLDVELTSLPNSVPEDLRSAPLLGAAENQPEPTGVFEDKLPEREQEQYWAYVPKDYNPRNKYALLVWLDPNGQSLKSTITRFWSPLCDERGMILVAPMSKPGGWQSDDAEFVKDVVAKMQKTYSIDADRVVLHGYARSGLFAWQLVFKFREIFPSAAIIGAPLQQPPPDNEPDYRLQFHLVTGDNDPARKVVAATAKALQGMKFPVVLTNIPEGGKTYPGEGVVPLKGVIGEGPVRGAPDQLQEIARWIDMLDRI